jgi:integrase
MHDTAQSSHAISNQEKARKFRFTKEAIDELTPPVAGRVLYYDQKTAGLALAVAATGKRVFHYYRKVNNKPKRIQIGSFPEWTIDQARRQVAEYNAEAARGIEPGETERKAKEEEAKAAIRLMTFGELFAKYYADHSVPHKRQSREDLLKYNRHIASGRWGVHIADKPASQVTRGEISQIHVSFGRKHPTSANRLLAVISSVYSKAIEWQLLEGPNPCFHIKKFPERSRERFLQPDEMPRLFEALRIEENETVRDFIFLCLFTGVRRTTVMKMKWEDLSFDREQWFIGMTKNGTPQTVPLVDEALVILKSRQEAAKDDEVYVFAGPGKCGHIIEPKKVWRRVLCRATTLGLLQKVAEARNWTESETMAVRHEALAQDDHGVELLFEMAKRHKIQLKPLDMRDLRVHDLRRTMGSWQANTGASLPIIGRSLNHKSPQSTQVYARLMIDPVRKSMQKATSAMVSGLIPD